MDEEMEDSNEVEYTFTAVEIDLDYEYDAVRFFDFSREESTAEARQAERWFDTAVSYPPSPFVARLINGQDVSLENVNTSPKPKPKDNASLLESNAADQIEVDQETCAVVRDDEGKSLNSRGTSEHLPCSYGQKLQNQNQEIRSGFTFYDHVMQDASKYKTKFSVKPYVPRTSTLMKPTASQLAKQSQPRQMCSIRSQKLMVDRNDKSSNNNYKVEIQAAKRQKLEGGHLNKNGETKQQMNFVHKLPKRDGNVDVNVIHANLKITIPREPDLETTLRAQRTRQNGSKEMQDTSTFRRFKALPLNRKILETPSLVPKRSAPRVPQFHEFHLKTSERAVQHSATVSVPAASCNYSDKESLKCDRTSSTECRDETRRCNLVVDTAKEEKTQSSHKFKALPLNRKIFSSKGDIGVFRNNKREITVPKEFNFHTDKRAQHNPPIELFNKLSLASEPKKLEQPDPASFPAKGLKENRWDPFQQEHQVKHEVKGKPPLNGGKQTSSGGNGRTTNGGLVSAISRSLGVR